MPWTRRDRLTIVIYHRVLPAVDPLFPDEMDAARFDRVCAWLRAGCNVIELGEGVRRLREQTLPPRAVALTFDDGYADNHDVALPILQRHGLNATFFVSPGFLDGGRMWNDTVIEALRRVEASSMELRRALPAAAVDVLPPDLQRLDLSGTAQRRRAIGRLLGFVKYLDPALRMAVVEALGKTAGVPLPDDLMMSADQVRRLDAAGMTIGAHTMTHPILGRLPDAESRAEILDSKRALEGLLGHRVDLFAYPNGKPDADYRACTVEQVRELGFEAAVSTAWGAAQAASDRFQLPRFTPWDRSAWRFMLRLANNLRAPVALAT